MVLREIERCALLDNLRGFARVRELYDKRKEMDEMIDSRYSASFVIFK